MSHSSASFLQSSSEPIRSSAISRQTSNASSLCAFESSVVGKRRGFDSSTSSSQAGTSSFPLFGVSHESTSTAFGIATIPAYSPLTTSICGSKSTAFGASVASDFAFNTPFCTSSATPVGASHVPLFGTSEENKYSFGVTTTVTFGSPTSPACAIRSTSAICQSTSASVVGAPFTSVPAFGASGNSFAFGASGAFVTPTFTSSLSPVPCHPTSESSFEALTGPAFGDLNTAVFGPSSSTAFGGSSGFTFGSDTSNSSFGSSFNPTCIAGPVPVFCQSTATTCLSGSACAFEVSNASTFGHASTVGVLSAFASGYGPSDTLGFGSSCNPKCIIGFCPSVSASANTNMSGMPPSGFKEQSLLFGSQTTTAAPGGTVLEPSVFGKKRGGSRIAAYTPTSEECDNNLIQHGGKLGSIAVLPIHKDKSLEELRWEDYQLRDKGPGAGPSVSGIGFGAAYDPSSFEGTSTTCSSSLQSPYSLFSPVFPAPDGSHAFGCGLNVSSTQLGLCSPIIAPSLALTDATTGPGIINPYNSQSNTCCIPIVPGFGQVVFTSMPLLLYPSNVIAPGHSIPCFLTLLQPMVAFFVTVSSHSPSGSNGFGIT